MAYKRVDQDLENLFSADKIDEVSDEDDASPSLPDA
jgi:hypothetical protein